MLNQKELIDKTNAIIAKLEARISQIEDRESLLQAIKQNFFQIIKDGRYAVDWHTGYFKDYCDLRAITDEFAEYINESTGEMDMWIIAIEYLNKVCQTPELYLSFKLQEEPKAAIEELHEFEKSEVATSVEKVQETKTPVKVDITVIENILSDLTAERGELRQELIEVSDSLKKCKVAVERQKLIKQRDEVRLDIAEVDEEIHKVTEFKAKVLARENSGDPLIADIKTLEDVVNLSESSVQKEEKAEAVNEISDKKNETEINELNEKVTDDPSENNPQNESNLTI